MVCFDFVSLTNLGFNPSLEKAILFAVGNTLVCDDLSEAKSLSWSGERFKGITVLNFFPAIARLILFKLFFCFLAHSCHH